MLARLAADTGGRFTRFTNDLSLAYARAQRDLACRYTLGFYLSKTEEGVPSRIAVNVLRPGLRALHPSTYVFRSDSTRRESSILAAFAAPGMFATPFLRAHLFMLQPRSPTEWDTLIAISFPVRFENAKNQIEIDFGAVLSRDSRTRYDFHRRVTLRLKNTTDTSERRFMFLEPVSLRPGYYELRVVMADTDGNERPGALAVGVEVPPIIEKDLTLVTPILGSRLDKNILVRGDDSIAGRSSWTPDAQAKHDITAAKGSFEPLLVQRIEEALDLAARNKVCRVARKNQNSDGGIERAVVGEEDLYELQKVPLALTKNDKVWCQNLFEILPEAVKPGDYAYETIVEVQNEWVEESLPFAIDEEMSEVNPSSGESDNPSHPVEVVDPE